MEMILTRIAKKEGYTIGRLTIEEPDGDELSAKTPEQTTSGKL